MIQETVLGPGLLTLDKAGTPLAMSEQVTECTLVPKVNVGDPRPVLSGSRIPGVRKETWSLKGKIIPDFGQTKSVQEWLFTNRGKVFDFEFIPRNDLGKAITGKLQAEATEIGGEVETSADVDFEFTLLTEPNIAATASASG